MPPDKTKMYENWQFAQLFVQSIIYIYILSRGYTKFLQIYLKTAVNTQIQCGFTEKQRGTEKFTPFSSDFSEILSCFMRFYSIFCNVNAKRSETPPFSPFSSVFSVFGQWEGKSPEKTGQGQSARENPKTIPPAAWAMGRGGSFPRFKQDGAGGAQDSTRKNF